MPVSEIRLGKPGPKPKYPWEAWSNGEQHIVDPDEYGVSLHILRTQLYTRAAQDQQKVQTSALEDGKLAFQFYTPNADSE